MTPLHIVHVLPYWYPAIAYGGIPRLAYGLCRALVRRGHRITVITTDARDEHSRLPPGRTVEDGITVWRAANLSNRLAYHHQAFLPPGLLRSLPDLRGADLFHIHGHRHLPGVFAHHAARRLGRPTLLMPNGTLPALERKVAVKALFDRWLGDAIVEGAQHFVAVSRAELNQMRQAGIPADRISLIPNGIDLAEFEALPPRGAFKARQGLSGRRIVLYLGKITPRKGVDHLIDAFSALPHRDVALVVAGNDMAGLLPGLKAKVAALGLTERVHFVGLVEGEQRLGALVDADVLAYPSTAEIFGLVPFEGLLAGAPAVVGDDCGCGELVAAAGAGLLVKYGDARALSQALARLLDDDAERSARVARGRAYIAQHFAWERVVTRMEAAYQRTLETPSGAPSRKR